jgi:nucleoside phosphorylase
MIYIFAALYAEVKPLIEALQLKKRMDSSHFQQFASRDGELLLTLTGVGMVSAAAAVGAVLSQGRAGAADLLLSVGSCAKINTSTGSCMELNTSISSCAKINTSIGSCVEMNASVGGFAKMNTSVGSCADLHASDIAEIPGTQTYLLHKLINESTGRSFYPDIVLDAQIPEAACITGARVLESPAATPGPLQSCEDRIETELRDQSIANTFLQKRLTSVTEMYTAEEAALKVEQLEHYEREAVAGAAPLLYDMESAAIYEAGSIFLGPHQMHFLRFVTDTGAEQVTRQQLEARAEEAAGTILSYIKKLRELMRMLQARQTIPTQEQEMEISMLGEELHCSTAMYYELRQYLKFAILSGIHWESAVDALRKTGKLPAGDRRAGKKVLNEIKHAILS